MITDTLKVSEFIAPHVNVLPKSGIRDFFEIVAESKNVISLGIGEPDFPTPMHIRAKAVESLERGDTKYTSNLGTPELRQALSRYMARSFGADYDWKSEILLTVGVSEAFDIALRAVVSPGDEVLYHEPAFVAYAPIIRMAHGVPVAVGTFRKDNFHVTVEELEKHVTPRTRVMVLNFPNNPTGATLDKADTEALADFAIRHNLLIISDEVYSELTYEGGRNTMACIPRIRDRLIFLNGFSKAWSMTGFRLGYVCAPPSLADAMMKIHQYCMMCASTVSQIAGLEALRDGDADIREMREAYDIRRRFIVDAFNRMGLDCFMPRGAFYVFPSIQTTGLTSEDFSVRLLNGYNVACVPGTAFGACGEGFVRCSYATGMDQIKEALARISTFIKTL